MTNIADSDDVWSCLGFDSLSAGQLYECLALRSAVFVVEQNCVYQDVDGLDLQSLHLMGRRDGRLVAYARLLPAGISYPEHAAIGRVVTEPSLRGTGIGHELVRRAIAAVRTSFGTVDIRISAQAHLTSFYASHGFAAIGSTYLEDGIEHRAMLLTR